MGSAFNGPEGVAVDSSGRVYVANNYGESVIEVAQSAGKFGAFNVGDSSGTITVGFTFDTGGKMSADVLAGGVSESDFVDAGTGSCTTNGLNHTYVANEVCTMDVYFTPSTWGPRYGAVELRDAGGDSDGHRICLRHGHSAPGNFCSRQCRSSAAGGFKNPTGLAMDGFGDIFVADVANNAVKEIESSGTVHRSVSTANGTLRR